MFADIVGFTGLSEDRDPEQVKNLVDRCFALLADDITAFGGRVDKVVGDAIVALFGAPIAHDDDAERAVRAALRMQETVGRFDGETGVGMRLRIGIRIGGISFLPRERQIQKRKRHSTLSVALLLSSCPVATEGSAGLPACRLLPFLSQQEV